MARHVADERQPEMVEGRDVGLVDQVTTKDASGVNVLARVLGLVAGAIPTIVGLIAVADIDWSGNGFDAPAVTVANIRLTPAVAVAVLVAGVIGLLAAALRDRGPKLAVGAIYVIAGIVVVTSNPTVQDVVLSDRLGWMAILVGAVMVVAGLLAVQRTSVRREVRTSSI
ncbi:MAG: hypothetical protein ACXWCM_00305 [Acidimicrobiales bacterium]